MTDTNVSPPPPPPPPPPEPNGEGKAWLEKLDPSLREHIDKNKYSTETPEDLINHLATSDMAAMRRLGNRPEDLLVKPAGSFDENKDAYLEGMRAFGAPEDKSGYAAPEGVELAEGVWDKVADVFAANGVPAWMAPELTKGVAEIVKGMSADAAGEQKTPEQLKADHIDALTGKVGAAKAQQMFDDARTVITAKGGEEFAQFLDETGLGNDPRMTTLLAKVAADYKESGIHLEPGNSNQGSEVSAGQAKERIAALEKDAGFMKRYRDKTDPGHRKAVEEMDALHEKAYPPKQ